MVNLRELIQSLTGKKPADTISEIQRLQALAADMDREVADSETELAQIAARRQQLLLDDADEALADDEARTGVLRRNIERAGLGRQRIAEELVEAKKAHRAARVTAFRAERDDIVRRLDGAMTAAVAVNDQARAWYDRVEAELGHHAIGSEFGGAIAFPFFAGEFVDAFRRNLSQMAGPRPVEPPAAAAVKQPASPKFASRPGPGGVVRPAAKPRPALPKKPPAGHSRVQVLRAGYESPSGEQLRAGDQVDLPEEVAQAAAQAGAVELCEVEA
ncbi:hypothetical protein GCM10007881_63960 [Mesorhizobium huakuii]|uniref:hypothetical protein n=1 Tax=Mesorhizobium huakuii TaxID=28104 RepID=UPI00235BF3A3|nr:hypothetical protein [Mesorhizobium huakuii]GLQ82873.1 hypothetical protein GCM10007881_63960 [Mesorhizobium huakuii]